MSTIPDPDGVTQADVEAWKKHGRDNAELNAAATEEFLGQIEASAPAMGDQPVAWRYRHRHGGADEWYCYGYRRTEYMSHDNDWIEEPLYATPRPAVDAGWRWRAQVQYAVDLLKETKQGSPARSAGHNARLVLEAALASLPSAPTAPEKEGE